MIEEKEKITPEQTYYIINIEYKLKQQINKKLKIDRDV